MLFFAFVLQGEGLFLCVFTQSGFGFCVVFQKYDVAVLFLHKVGVRFFCLCAESGFRVFVLLQTRGLVLRFVQRQDLVSLLRFKSRFGFVCLPKSGLGFGVFFAS